MGDPQEPAIAPRRRRRRGSRRRALIGRTITVLALLPLAGRLPVHARILAALLGDPRVPASRKALIAGAFGYAASPMDLVPNRIPLLGAVDDLVIAALAFDAFLDGVPDEVLEEKLSAVGLPRAVFDDDVRRVRRLVPRPLGRLVHRFPAALELGARVVREAQLGRRVRAMLHKEGSPA
jgi:uncharacterized membrane protein YkvA (DUF1232 family)